MQRRQQFDVNPFNSILSILTLVLVFIGLYFIASTIFKLLAYLAPFLLILALILKHEVVFDYGKWLVNLFRKNFLWGIGAAALTFFGFPVIAGFLALKAYLYRKSDKLKSASEIEVQGEYVDYEELDNDEPTIDLKELERKTRKRSSDYDQYFE